MLDDTKDKTATEVITDRAQDKEIDEQSVSEQEQKLEGTTATRLETIFEKEESLDLSAETSSDSEVSTLEKDKPAEVDDDEDGPTPAEREAEAKLEAQEKKDKVEKAKDEDADKGEVKKDTPKLSDAYYRAAIHRGWTEEEIKEQFEANPELTIRTLGNVYEEVNRSSSEFAAIGRARKEQILRESAPKVAEQPVTESEFKGVDIEKLRKDYPDDPIVDVVAEQQAQRKIMFDEIQALKDSRSVQVIDRPSGVYDPHTEDINRRSALIEQQIEMFFNSDELNNYKDFYGNFDPKIGGWNSLMPAEKQNRWDVINMMDQIITGAATLGEEIKIPEAMQRAHLSVTEPIREKVIRDDIISKISKRDKSLTLKPSSSAKPESTKPRTQQELEDVTKERLSKIKGW